MILTLYSALMRCAQPLVRLKLKRRATTEPLYGRHMEERFGHYTVPAQTTQGLVWIHAVSLGETRAAAVLMAQLRKDQAGIRFLLTHGTATGRAEGQKLLQNGDVQVWQPWDSAVAVRRFLHHFVPRIGILMETELWPNLVAQAVAVGVPMVLANARLSEKSFQKTRRFDWLARPTYQALAAVWAQTADDAARLAQSGANVTAVVGNLKFDAQPDPAQVAAGRALRERIGRPVLLLASSRDREELEFLTCIIDSSNIPSVISNKFATIKSIKNQKINANNITKNLINDENLIKKENLVNSENFINNKKPVQLLIVPRHPQRFDEVAQLLLGQGLSVARRSQSSASFEVASHPEDAAIWLGDSVGEMAFYYGLADVALLGGSFEPLGGQNLIEAAACGCPVVMGPHTFNFADAAELALQAGAAQRATDLEDALRLATQWLADPAARQHAATLAQGFAREHQGAAARLAQAIWELLLRAR